jgi:hypothetical protein
LIYTDLALQAISMNNRAKAAKNWYKDLEAWYRMKNFVPSTPTSRPGTVGGPSPALHNTAHSVPVAATTPVVGSDDNVAGDDDDDDDDVEKVAHRDAQV